MTTKVSKVGQIDVFFNDASSMFRATTPVGEVLEGATLAILREKLKQAKRKDFKKVEVVDLSETVEQVSRHTISRVEGNPSYTPSYKEGNSRVWGQFYVYDKAELATLESLGQSIIDAEAAFRKEVERLRTVLTPLSPEMVDKEWGK